MGSAKYILRGVGIEQVWRSDESSLRGLGSTRPVALCCLSLLLFLAVGFSLGSSVFLGSLISRCWGKGVRAPSPNYSRAGT